MSFDSMCIDNWRSAGIWLWHWVIPPQQYLLLLLQNQLKYRLLLVVILFDNKLRTQMSSFLGEADVEYPQTYWNTKRQIKQVNMIWFPIVNFPCNLISCHTTVRSNNIDVNFYSELSSVFVLLISSAIKSSITACTRARFCFLGCDRCIPASLLFIHNFLKVCIGFSLN